MFIQHYIETFRTRGVDALNTEIQKVRENLVSILEALEKVGFSIKWHYDSDAPGERDYGVVVAGP